MRRNYLWIYCAAGLSLTLGAAENAAPEGSKLRWEGAFEPGASWVLLHNLTAAPNRVALGNTLVDLPANGLLQLPAAEFAAGPATLRGNTDVLMLQVPEGFDPTRLRVELASELPLRAPVDRPAVRHGATGAAVLTALDGAAQVEVTVELLAPHTSVRLRQLDSWGNELTAVVASGTKPVRWSAALGPAGGASRIEMETLQGEAQGAVRTELDGVTGKWLQLRSLAAAGGGLAKFVPTINWEYTPDLSYSITNAPANVCGDLHVSRNGGLWTRAPGWICTDASGNASRGPWAWANQVGDEVATGYIVWANGLSTNSASHIWDKSQPTVLVTSGTALPAPTSFAGTATDLQFGAGFAAPFGVQGLPFGGGSSQCEVRFKNLTTNKHWCSGDSTYAGISECREPCSLTGMPARSVSWSATQVPPGFAHHTGHCYRWTVIVYENRTYSRPTEKNGPTFCVP